MAAQPLFKGNELIPADAIVLFDGKDLSQWQHGDGDPASWKIEDGYAITQKADIRTKQVFGDCQLHVEFWLPLMAEARGQARSNSGVFFMGFTYEIQVLDSYELDSQNNDCGAMYSIHPPLVNACRPPETWQTYDAVFHAPRFDADGAKIANARITLLQNGVLIHDNIDIPYPTPDHSFSEPAEPGPIQLQYHGNDVRFRNVWVRPI
jgi:hypothetical protein